MGMTASRLRERRERERLAEIAAKAQVKQARSPVHQEPESAPVEAIEPEPITVQQTEPVIVRKPQQQNNARRR